MYKLRELERYDIQEINKWHNALELTSHLGAPYRCINRRNNTIRCAITKTDNDLILGVITLASIDYMNQSAELHLMIGKMENGGKSIGTFAITEILNHAFYNMNLRRVELTVLADNIQAQKLYEKCGFKKEGLKREAKYKQGKFVDMYIYAALKSDLSYKTEKGGGILHLPTYTISIINNRNEIDKCIRACDTAFSEPVAKRLYYSALLEKISLCAIFLKAEANETYGYAALYANDYKDRTAYLSLIAVSIEHQTKGVGATLLKASEEIAIERGLKYMRLEVNCNNTKAISFYERHGFTKDSISTEHSFFMSKALTSK